MPAQTAPSPLRERAGVRGNIRLWWSFRSLRASLKALSFSEATLKLLLSNYWVTLSFTGEEPHAEIAASPAFL